MSIFNSDRVIKQKISEANLATYLVGFDFDDSGIKAYRWDDLISVLTDVIPEFAFGFHNGSCTPNTQLVKKVCDAAKSIYNIDIFQQVRDIYSNNGHITDDVTDQYLRKGEFGELILHLLLRDFHSTIPLISKIYFKDSLGLPVHGFDAVHVQPNTRALWLGESKLYIDGKKGIQALIDDILNHFKRDYLKQEFTIVSRKIEPFDNIPEKNHWLNILDSSTTLEEQLNSITIPLLCTYSSDSFNSYNDETLPDFIRDYETEVRDLQRYFDTNNNHPLKTNLNIILLLFPVKCKVELVKRLHHNLSLLQGVRV